MENYKIYIIEIMIYLNSIIISIIITIAFYTDNTMHKIYDNEGNYNLLNSLPQILVSNISTEIITFAFEKIIDFHDKFIDLKKNLKKSSYEEEEEKTIINRTWNNELNRNTYQDNSIEISNSGNNSAHIYNIRSNRIINNDQNNEKDKIAVYIKNRFRHWSIVFYCIIIIINIFGWYYAFCFSAVFKNTQKHLLKDLFYSIIFNGIICCLISIIKLFIQLLKQNKRCIFMKYTDLKVIKCIIEIFLFIIEMIMEYFIIYFFSKIKI